MRQFLETVIRWAKISLAVLFVLVIVVQVGPHFLRDTLQVTVAKTERVTNLDTGTSKYLVMTDKGTFENTDSWLELKANSSDIYGKLVPGKKVTITVYGIRFSPMSMYKNIVSLEK